MARIKGTDMVILRQLIKQKGENAEREFLTKLPQNLRDRYGIILTTSWTDIEEQSNIYEAAANFLFPGQKNNVSKLLCEVAKKSYSGIYRIFIKIPTITFIIKTAAKLWTTYYDRGRAFVEDISQSSLTFTVIDFPELTYTLREATNGHIQSLMEMVGNRNIKVDRDDSNPNNWKWHISWTR